MISEYMVGKSVGKREEEERKREAERFMCWGER